MALGGSYLLDWLIHQHLKGDEASRGPAGRALLNLLQTSEHFSPTSLCVVFSAPFSEVGASDKAVYEALGFPLFHSSMRKGLAGINFCPVRQDKAHLVCFCLLGLDCVLCHVRISISRRLFYLHWLHLPCEAKFLLLLDSLVKLVLFGHLSCGLAVTGTAPTLLRHSGSLPSLLRVIVRNENAAEITASLLAVLETTEVPSDVSIKDVREMYMLVNHIACHLYIFAFQALNKALVSQALPGCALDKLLLMPVLFKRE